MTSRGTTSIRRHLTVNDLTEYAARPLYSRTVTGAPVAAYRGRKPFGCAALEMYSALSVPQPFTDRLLSLCTLDRLTCFPSLPFH